MMRSETVSSPSVDLLKHAINALRDAINALETFSLTRAAGDPPVNWTAERPSADAISTLREAISRDSEVADWQIIARERLRKYMTRGGRRAAAMLFYMMERPGILISQDELMKVLGTKSPDAKIIKVYICHLRSTFKSLGWHEELIETGRRSYALRAEGFSRILELIQEKSQDIRM